MQPATNFPPDIKKQRRRRRRRPRNRNRQPQEPAQEEDTENSSIQAQQIRLSLHDLISEASALEKQLNELQTQLKLNYAAMPNKDQGRLANAIAAEQISATEEETDYLRKSLKEIYRQVLTTNMTYATSHRIDDKLWRYIIYASIEEIRSKLRKLNPEEDNQARQTLTKLLFHRIDSGFKFYRDLNAKFKASHHIDTKTIGVDLFKQGTNAAADEQVAIILQSNYICMGDLARYRASQSSRNKKAAEESWALARSCYHKAADVYRFNGKPYSQLALISLSSGSAIDVVWYYCMSLAMKFPSSVGRDNLHSFYSKIRFSNSKSPVKDDKGQAIRMISTFVESFLQIHKEFMFAKNNSSEIYGNSEVEVSDALEQAVRCIIQSSCEEPGDSLVPKQMSSAVHILKSTLMRTLTITFITVWNFGERMKEKANFTQRPRLQAGQIYLLTYGFRLLANLCKSTQNYVEEVKDQLKEEKHSQLKELLHSTLLPSVSIWCTFVFSNLSTISQYCGGAGATPRGALTGSPNQFETWKKELVNSMQALLSFLIGHVDFPDPVLHVLPITYPLSEDLLLLGVSPLTSFHYTVDYFKEHVYDGAEENATEARKQIRWGRIREMVKKVADSPSFDFVQYNQAELNYSVIDENAKRQQKNRFMKALATQRLMEQVSSLEKNVNRMTLSTSRDTNSSKKEVPKLEVYTVIVDVTAFLDGLNKIKRWSSQTLNANSRSQRSVLEVIVPLEVIDSLDVHKKGTSHTNLQARESIRYLDQKLLETHRNDSMDLVASSLRTQKISEQLSSWSEAEQFWIGEESQQSSVANVTDIEELEDNVKTEDEKEEQEEHEENEEIEEFDSDSDSSSGEELFKRRRFDEEEELESESEAGEETDEEDDEEVEDEPPLVCSDVPKAYRPIISCLLYYYAKRREENASQSSTSKKPERLVLVTNDENLAWWAELFGDPETGRRLYIKTVDEWDRTVGTMDFEKVYTHSWRKR
ncbi:hypothetical protein CLU79DRAFT_777380 [Phycomyces nitens]|nr:hypothetical protein CLU79DRAFT_777380 [Phycomyces nitens]